jgi:hypothetical protein
LLFGIGNGRGDGDRHRLGDVVLQRKNVSEIAVVPLGPDMIAGLGLDQLRGDADAICGPSHAAFEDIAHAELAPDLLHVYRSALVREGGVTRDDE